MCRHQNVVVRSSIHTIWVKKIKHAAGVLLSHIPHTYYIHVEPTSASPSPARPARRSTSHHRTTLPRRSTAYRGSSTVPDDGTNLSRPMAGAHHPCVGTKPRSGTFLGTTSWRSAHPGRTDRPEIPPHLPLPCLPMHHPRDRLCTHLPMLFGLLHDEGVVTRVVVVQARRDSLRVYREK